MYVSLCQSGEQRIYRRPIPDHRGKSLQRIKETLLRENPDGTLTLTRCCQVGGLGGTPYRDGSFEYYISEKMRDNDAKATGPFIMGCLQLGK